MEFLKTKLFEQQYNWYLEKLKNKMELIREEIDSIKELGI